MEVVTLEPSKGYIISNFRQISLLSTELNILAKILAKDLAHIVERLVEERLVEEAQTCDNPGRSIHNNSLERFGKISGKGGEMLN